MYHPLIKLVRGNVTVKQIERHFIEYGKCKSK